MDFRKTRADKHLQYTLNLQKALIVTLLAFIFLVHLRLGIDLDSEPQPLPKIIIDVENIPATRQAHRPLPPKKPAVPVPSDDVALPEDLTIQEMDLSFSEMSGVAQQPAAMIKKPPRPIIWQLPEYPESERKSRVEGFVKANIHVDATGKVTEVIILENSTNNDKCAQAARKAAFASRFLPAQENGKAVPAWISQQYEFRIKE